MILQSDSGLLIFCNFIRSDWSLRAFLLKTRTFASFHFSMYKVFLKRDLDCLFCEVVKDGITIMVFYLRVSYSAQSLQNLILG